MYSKMIYNFWPGNTNGPKLTTPRHAVDRDYYSRSKQPFASILSVMGNVHAPLLDKQQPQIKDILTGGVYQYPSPPRIRFSHLPRLPQSHLHRSSLSTGFQPSGARHFLTSTTVNDCQKPTEGLPFFSCVVTCFGFFDTGDKNLRTLRPFVE
jgi:hypothetical protein